MATPTERLPWSQSEPPPATAAAAAPTKQAGRMWPWYLLFLLLIGAVCAGAWWLSQGEDARPPELPAEQSIPVPVTQATSAEQSPQELAANVDAPAAENVASTQPIPRSSSRPIGSRATIPSSRPNLPQRGVPERAIFTADEPAAAAPAFGPDPAVAGNSRPYSGRVVQLGAFPTRVQAEDSWKRITRRYPYLLTKSKMVNTVYVEGLGGGRPTRMYRLQLGTSSQAQSVVICQQLEQAGHSCVVVY